MWFSNRIFGEKVEKVEANFVIAKSFFYHRKQNIQPNHTIRSQHSTFQMISSVHLRMYDSDELWLRYKLEIEFMLEIVIAVENIQMQNTRAECRDCMCGVWQRNQENEGG